MKEKTPVEMGILGLSFAKSRVSLFDIEDGKLVHKGYAPLPENGEKKYERSVLKDDKPVKAVASLPKKGIYESELVMMLDAVQNSPDEVPYYPMLLLAVENKSNYLLPVSFMDRWNGDPEDEFVQKLLSAFSESLVQNGSCPGEIRCRDERTYSILSDFCDKAGIKISIYEKRMACLDSAEDFLVEQYQESRGSDSMHEIISMIMNMSDAELKTLPAAAKGELMRIISTGGLPEDVSQALMQKLLKAN